MNSHERANDTSLNNVTYQRCQYAYEYARPYIHGKKVLDVGCGLAYGTAALAKYASQITGLDYDAAIVHANRETYKSLKNIDFFEDTIPPLNFPDETFEVITSFQFIEHIKQRKFFLQECFRVLKKRGVLLLSTPNNKMSLARNPFHIHEYTFDEMRKEAGEVFRTFDLLGLNGNEKVNKYYQENGKWVRKILKWDVLGLHKIIPTELLTIPYNLITNMMRKKLMEQVSETSDISTKDFFLEKNNLDKMWDIYLIARKN